MLAVTIDSTSAWLLPYSAEWGSAPVATFELLTDAEAGLSGREHRRAFSATLRTSLKFGSQLFQEEAEDLLAALEESTDNRPILVPFWPVAGLFGDRGSAPVAGGLRVWFEADWSLYEIGLDSAADPSGYSSTALTAPLLWCRWLRRPAAELLTGAGDLDIDFEVIDVGAAAYALSPQGGALTYGATVGGVATPVLSADLVNWLKPTASSEITVARERIGYGRAEAEEFVAQLARRSQKLAVRCVGAAEIAQLIRLFLDRRGNVGSWWCPAFNDPTESLLVRFKSAKLQLTWATPTQADATIEVIAVPTEETLPAGETRGTTLGDIGAKWWGYIVTANGTTYRYTSYESDINAGALGLFTHAPLEHGDITMELNLVRHECTLKVGAFGGSPFELLRLQPGGMEITVQVVEGMVASPAAATVIFAGKLAGTPSFTGAVMEAEIAGPTSLFDTQVPVAVASKRCWAPLFSAPCSVARTATAATLTAAGTGGALTFAVTGTFASDHFRYGYAERLLGGVKTRLPIASSGAASGTAVSLTAQTVGAPPVGLTLPDSGWALFPGCDHSFERCQVLGGKFRGFPRFPKANPALVPVKQTTPSGGKK